MTTTIALSLTNPTTVRVFSKFTFLDPEKILDRYAADLDNFVTNTDGNVSEAAILSKISERDNIILGEIQRRLDMNGLMTSAKLETVNAKLDNVDNSIVLKTRGIMTELVPQLLDTFASKIRQDMVTDAPVSAERLEQILHATETHVMQRFDATQQKITENAVKQEQLTSSVAEFIGKSAYNAANASMKGQVSELELMDVLQDVFHNLNADIERCSGTGHTCDFSITRPDRGTIFIENKCYAKTVPPAEVDKFKRDLIEQKAHGIFLSQNSRIGGNVKQFFDVVLDPIHNIVQVYMSHVNYDPKLIKFAVSVLDSHVDMLNRLSSPKSEFAVTAEQIDAFYENYVDLMNKKFGIIKSLEDVLGEVEKLGVPDVLGFLKQHKKVETDKFTCIYCNHIGHNAGSLAAHQRGCKAKKQTEALSTTPLVKTGAASASASTSTKKRAKAQIDDEKM